MADLVSYALTTLADVKESLGIDSGNTSQDNLIKRKINQATEMIEAYCGLDNDHHFKQTTYTDEVYDATSNNYLRLKARPLITLTSISARDTYANEDDWTTLDTENYFTDEYSNVVSNVSSFWGGFSRWRVTYTAGFATIPSDLAEACVMLASFLVENASSGGSAVKSKQEGQRKIEYFDPGQASSNSLFEQLGIDDMLARYKNYYV